MKNRITNQLINNSYIKYIFLFLASGAFIIFSPSLILFDTIPFYGIFSRLIFIGAIFLFYLFIIKNLIKNKMEIINIIISKINLIFKLIVIKKKIMIFNIKQKNKLKKYPWILAFKTIENKNHLLAPEHPSLYFDNLTITFFDKIILAELNLDQEKEDFLLLKCLKNYFNKKTVTIVSYFYAYSKNTDLSNKNNKYINYVSQTNSNLKHHHLIDNPEKMEGFVSYIKLCQKLNIEHHLQSIPVNPYKFSAYNYLIKQNILKIISSPHFNNKEAEIICLPAHIANIRDTIDKTNAGFNTEGTISFFNFMPSHLSIASNYYKKSYTKIYIIIIFTTGLLSYFANTKQLNYLNQNITNFTYKNEETRKTLDNKAQFSLLEDANKVSTIYNRSLLTSLSNIEIFFPLYMRNKLSNFENIVSTHIFIPLITSAIEESLNSDNLNLKKYTAIKYCLTPHNSHSSEILNFISAYKNSPPNVSDKYFAKIYQEKSIPCSHMETIKNSQNTIFNRENVENLLFYEMSSDAEKDNFSLKTKIKNLCNLFDCRNDLVIPSYYTFSGYKRLVKQDLIKYEGNIQKLTEKNNKFKILHPKHMKKFWENYDYNYIQTWNDILAKTTVKKFFSLEETITRLKSTKQIVSYFLQTLKDNTYPFSGEREKIFENYRWVDHFLGYPGKPSAEAKIFYQDMDALIKYLTPIQSSADSSKAEFEAIRSLFTEENKDNPLVIFMEHAKSLPSPMQRWANQIAENIIDLLLADTMKYIQTQWQKNVLSNYKTDIRDPFFLYKNSKEEPNLNNMRLFFSEEGVFSKFLSTYIKPFIHTEHEPWLARSFYSHELPLNKQTLLALNALSNFSRDIINTDTNKPITINIVPRYLDSKAKSCTFIMGERLLQYRHGPQVYTAFEWPSNPMNIALTVNDFNNDEHHLSYEGDLALFKLLLASKCKEVDAQHLLCDASIEKFHFAYEISTKPASVMMHLSTIPIVFEDANLS